jgi:peptidoglycan/LPS O-acetylase OafA/YrhL
MPWTYRPELDGLRSIAVYLVLLFHAGLGHFDGGFIGVDLFFVISGFVVTNVILSEIDETGRLDLGRFYARRVRRLLPAAVTVILATAAVFLLIAPVVRRLALVGDAQSALLYVANWNFLLEDTDYFAGAVEESPYLHFWSLAVEEQFYLLFPVLLLFLVGRTRARPWALPAALGGVLVLSVVSQLVWGRLNPTWAYYGTDARLYQLMAGAVLAVVLRRGLLRLPRPALSHLAALTGLATLLVLATGLVDTTPTWRGLGATAAAVLLVGGLGGSAGLLLPRLLSRRTPVFLGKVSYGTYLWHWPVVLVLGEFLDVRPLLVSVLTIALSTGLAALSFEVLELPVRTASSLRRFRWSTAGVGVLASALLAVLVVPSVLESERTPRVAATGAPGKAARDSAGSPVIPADQVVREAPTEKERKARVPKGMDWQTVLDDYGPNRSCEAKDPEACIVVEGGGPHIALVGDSHARMLGPLFVELAKEHDLTLSMNVVPSCPWQAGLRNHRPPKAHQDKCIARRGEWYDRALPQLDPDVVVLSSISYDGGEWAEDLERDGGSEESLEDLRLSTTMETIEQIESHGARALIVKNIQTTPDMNAVECLSGARFVADCEVPISQPPVSDAYYRIAAERYPDVYTVDINPIVCGTGPTCLPMVDDIVVWRDDKHLTTEITTHFRQQIWQAIRRSGAVEGL